MKMHKTLLLGFFLILGSVFSHGQGVIKFDPTTTWPYLYEEFQPGTVLNNKGNRIDYDKLNVNVANGRMHFVKDGKIMEADMMTVHVVRVGDDVYLNALGKLMKVLKETDNGAVLSFKEVDVEKMSRANIGYGTSAVASTQNVATMALESSTGSTLNRSLSDAASVMMNGDPLSLKESTYLIVDGLLVPARKKDVASDQRFDGKKVENYLKNYKIKWNNVEHLSSLVEFLHTEKIN
jgi:hypothetical protein